MKFVEDNQQVFQHLPDERDLKSLPKPWLSNVIYTVLGDLFAEWVKARIVERNDKIVEKRNLAIELDPQITLAFRNSNAVSSK